LSHAKGQSLNDEKATTSFVKEIGEKKNPPLDGPPSKEGAGQLGAEKERKKGGRKTVRNRLRAKKWGASGRKKKEENGRRLG